MSRKALAFKRWNHTYTIYVQRYACTLTCCELSRCNRKWHKKKASRMHARSSCTPVMQVIGLAATTQLGVRDIKWQQVIATEAWDAKRREKNCTETMAAQMADLLLGKTSVVNYGTNAHTCTKIRICTYRLSVCHVFLRWPSLINRIRDSRKSFLLTESWRTP